MRNTGWISSLKGCAVVVTMPAWLADKHDLASHANGTIRAVTDKATGLDVGRHAIVWLPLSRIEWIERLLLPLPTRY